MDIYALGAVGYFLLAGRRVFEGSTHVELYLQHVTQPPKPIAEVSKQLVPPELEAIIMKCLAKQPADRYPSTTAVAEALEAMAPVRDWDRTAAKRWWRAFRDKQASTPATDAPTRTITIDIEHRG